MTKAQENIEISIEQNISLLLLQVTDLWRSRMSALLEEYHLNLTQFILLKNFDDLKATNTPIVQKNLVNRCSIDKMTVSKSLRLIEKKGFISRFPAEFDKRAMQIELTELGRRMLYLALIDVEALGATFYKELSPKKEKSLKKTLNKLIKSNTSPS